MGLVTATVRAVVLALVGSLLVRLVLRGRHVDFVKPGMGPALLAAGAVLLVLAVLATWEVVHPRDVAGPDTARPSDGEPEHGRHAHRDHEHGGPGSAWLLFLPVAAILLVPPTPLGVFTAARIDASAPPGAADTLFPPLQDDPADLTLGDFVSRAVWDGTGSLAGHRVRLVGFASPEDSSEPAPARPGEPTDGVAGGQPGGWLLTRLGLACCAADAYALKIRPIGADPVPAGTWVEVVGTWLPGSTEDDAQDPVPELRVESVTTVSAPDIAYELP